jgi:hypothetical protein
MSDVPQGPGWWQASDGKWYAPEQFPGGYPTSPPPTPGQPPMYQPYQVYQPGYVPPQNEPLAVWSLVLAIAGIPLLCCWIGIIGSILGIVFGTIARKRIRESGGRLTGDGLALAGLIIGIVGVVLGVLWIVFNVISASIDLGT